jgi:nucleoside-diphosphate-sugar epimerase
MIGGKNICAITGASGYVGGRIRDYFIENGWIVYELTHDLRELRVDDRPVVSYSLEEEIRPRVLSVLEKSDLLIHCAYDFRLVDWQSIWEVNVNGSVRLLNGAKSVGVKKIIVISTMSAFEGCKSRYGKAKLAIEREARRADAVIIRPGLVFGKCSGGMIGALERIVSISGIVPLIGHGSQILHLAHEGDLCQLIFKLATEQVPGISEPILAASEKGITLRDILQILASVRGKKMTFIPIPWRLAWSGVKLLELVRLHIGFRSDSIISLVNLDPKPSFKLTKQIGVTFRDFNFHTAAS